MMEDFTKKLNIESDTFSTMKRDWDFVLQRLLGNMQEKGATEGSITLKVDVSFTKEFIPNYDPDIKGESREISKPKFTHKVTSAVQIKDEKKGNLDSEMELVFDEDTGEYVMRPVANTEQRTIFDKDFQDDEAPKQDEEENRDSGPKQIPQLPGPTEDTVIDADFKEVEETGEQEEDAREDSADGLEDVTDELMGDEGQDLGEDETDDYDYDEPEGEE